MEIRNRVTGDLTTVSQFKALHPNTSFPKQVSVQTLDSYGYDPVLNGVQPIPGEYEVVVRDGVEEVGGQWFTKFAVVDMFQDLVDEENTVVKTVQEQKDEYDAKLLAHRLKAADYKGFWRSLIRSNTYAALKASAKVDLEANVLATELISLLSDAKTGNLDAEALQAGIWEVVAALTPELTVELQGLMNNHGLGDYTLAPA